jgi:hypothetical protein
MSSFEPKADIGCTVRDSRFSRSQMAKTTLVRTDMIKF